MNTITSNRILFLMDFLTICMITIVCVSLPKKFEKL